MVSARTSVPAVDGWFTMDAAHPRLMGSRCTNCHTFYFPRETFFCRNPDCNSRQFEDVALSSNGRLWSWTTNHYPPPAPYVAADPFLPFTIAAVELEDEHMVVLGQVADDVDPADLRSGMEVELALGTLFEDDDHTYIVWKWRPVLSALSGR